MRPKYHTSLIAVVWLFCVGLLCATVLTGCDSPSVSASTRTSSSLSSSRLGTADGMIAMGDSAATADAQARALADVQHTNRAIETRVYAIANAATTDAAWLLDAAGRKVLHR